MSGLRREEQDQRLAYALFRATMGLDVLLHGVHRIAKGPSAFADSLVPMFAETPLPAAAVHAFGLALPWVEAALGALLLVGLATRGALVASSLLMAALVFGTGLRGDWNTLAIQVLYVVAYYLLLAHACRNSWALDRLIARDAQANA